MRHWMTAATTAICLTSLPALAQQAPTGAAVTASTPGSVTAAGKLLAPQVVPAGFLEGESPFSANNGFIIKDLQGAKDAVDWYAQRGYPQLKIYNSFPKAILAETVAYAHLRGMRVSSRIRSLLQVMLVATSSSIDVTRPANSTHAKTAACQLSPYQPRQVTRAPRSVV